LAVCRELVVLAVILFAAGCGSSPSIGEQPLRTRVSLSTDVITIQAQVQMALPGGTWNNTAGKVYGAFARHFYHLPSPDGSVAGQVAQVDVGEFKTVAQATKAAPKEVVGNPPLNTYAWPLGTNVLSISTAANPDQTAKIAAMVHQLFTGAPEYHSQ
jgi:hypothetical protein